MDGVIVLTGSVILALVAVGLMSAFLFFRISDTERRVAELDRQVRLISIAISKNKGGAK